jgi:hypothetical protein
MDNLNEFWGEPISIYTDADARDDGIISDISNLGIYFNGRQVNRITIGAADALQMDEKQPVTARNNLKFVADHSEIDDEGSGDPWGIFRPDPRLGNKKLWLVPNEVHGYTLMRPEDY